MIRIKAFRPLVVIAIAVVLLVPIVAQSGTEEIEYDNYVNDFYYGEHWENLDNEFTPATAPWDWETTQGDYKVRVKEDITAGQVIEFSTGGAAVYLQPMALEWSNDLSQIQAISVPQVISPIITNHEVVTMGMTKYEGAIDWQDAYGLGIDFEWRSTPVTLKKTLMIESLSSLPEPEQYIIDGGGAFLRLNMVFDPSSNLDIYVDNELWNQQSTAQTFENIEFRLGEDMLWYFSPLLYWDVNEAEEQSIATLRKSGNSLYIEVHVPYDWLQTAVFPVYVDADVSIGSGVSGSMHQIPNRVGVHWTSDSGNGVGYVIYVDTSFDLYYRKTTDGGATWGSSNLIDAGSIYAVDTWADWETEGDTGTNINIAYICTDDDDVLYAYLDTSTDSTGTDEVYNTATAVNPQAVRDYTDISITKSRGGRIYIVCHYQDTLLLDREGHYYSSDGDTWYSGSTGWWEDSADPFLAFPAGLTDDDDYWLLYYDDSADIITLKTYDASGNSWSESSSIKTGVDLTMYALMGWGGAIRHSDNHLIACWWNDLDSSTADIDCYDITSSLMWSERTDVVTDLSESFMCSVMIDQSSDDIYVVYCDGDSVPGGSFLSKIDVRYKVSTNGGTSWGTAVEYTELDDDFRWVGAGSVKESGGGRWYPIAFNDDTDEIVGNYGNSVAISAPAEEGYPYSWGTIIG